MLFYLFLLYFDWSDLLLFIGGQLLISLLLIRVYEQPVGPPRVIVKCNGGFKPTTTEFSIKHSVAGFYN